MAEDEELHIACFDSRPMRATFRYAALLVGCLAVGVAFCFDLFAVYGETFKVAFGFTQKELAVIISAAHLGLISALPTGILVQKYDPRWLSGGAFILSTLSCLLIWGTTYHLEFYKQYFYISAIFYFFLGCSGGLMYMLALSVNLLNFSHRHSGLVSGIIHCMRSVVLGALLVIYDFLYGHFEAPFIPILSDGNTTVVVPTTASEGSYDDVRFLQQFFQVMLLVYGGVNFLACVFYGDYRDITGDDDRDPSDDGTENEMVPIRTAVPIHVYGTQNGKSSSSTTPNSSASPESVTRDTASEGSNSSNGNGLAVASSQAGTTSSTVDLVLEGQGDGEKDTTGQWGQLFKNRLFHLLLWPSVFLFAMRNAYVTNLSVIMASFGLQGGLRFVVYAIPIVGTISTPLLGILADLLGHKVPRSLFYFLLAGGLIFINLANMGFAGAFPLVVVTTVWCQLASSCVLTLGPSLHLKLFDAETFPAGWGIVTLLQTLVTLLTQLLLAVLYDVFTPAGAMVCTGFKCYILYFLVCSLMAYSAAVVLFFVVRHEFETRTTTTR